MISKNLKQYHVLQNNTSLLGRKLKAQVSNYTEHCARKVDIKMHSLITPNIYMYVVSDYIFTNPVLLVSCNTSSCMVLLLVSTALIIILVATVTFIISTILMKL